MADLKDLMKLRVVDLKERLQAMGKSPKGKKADLAQQLQEALLEEAGRSQMMEPAMIEQQEMAQPPMPQQTMAAGFGQEAFAMSQVSQPVMASTLLQSALSQPEPAQQFYQQYQQQVYEAPANFGQLFQPQPMEPQFTPIAQVHQVQVPVVQPVQQVFSPTHEPASQFSPGHYQMNVAQPPYPGEFHQQQVYGQQVYLTQPVVTPSTYHQFQETPQQQVMYTIASATSLPSQQSQVTQQVTQQMTTNDVEEFKPQPMTANVSEPVVIQRRTEDNLDTSAGLIMKSEDSQGNSQEMINFDDVGLGVEPLSENQFNQQSFDSFGSVPTNQDFQQDLYQQDIDNNLSPADDLEQQQESNQGTESVENLESSDASVSNNDEQNDLKPEVQENEESIQKTNEIEKVPVESAKIVDESIDNNINKNEKENENFQEFYSQNNISKIEELPVKDEPNQFIETNTIKEPEKENNVALKPTNDEVKSEGQSKEDQENSQPKEKLSKNQKRKQRKKKRNQQKKQDNEKKQQEAAEDEDRMDIDEEDEEQVDIEYVPEEVAKDPVYFQYLKVFDRFRTGESSKKDDLVEEIVDPVKKMLERKKPVELELKDEDDKKDGEPKLSKRKLKQLTRMSVAELKQRVSHPELVEMHDVTAKDPLLLLHLKATRNTVPVPRHWCYKRKYLQGKRGFEKPPFKLPEFIRKTGIMEMRQALQEKEDSKSLKAKMREKIRPKMGKIDIDYQKLHDAFFKWQTKPKMTIHGDLYYEGKEFETRLKEKKPGELSNELRTALGMPIGPNSHKCPPPWLIAMQRYGPPPSYPNIKIPGLNARIPEGCSFGYHAGGWGKPPVDEYGRPLYGDVFGLSSSNDVMHPEEEVDRTLWGELESESEEEEEEEEDEDAAASSAPSKAAPTAKEPDESGFVTPAEGLVTPSGLTSIPAGVETPDMIELRKRKQIEAEMERSDNPSLYTVLAEKKADRLGREMMASTHTYDVSTTTLRKGQGIEVALDPSELEHGALDPASVTAKYEQTMKEQSSHLAKEDLSDMVAEHAARQKRKKQQDSAKSSKKYQFKF